MGRRLMGAMLVFVAVAGLSAFSPQGADAWSWSNTCYVDDASFGRIGLRPGIYTYASHADMWDDSGNCWFTNVPVYYLRGSFSFGNVPVNRGYHFRIIYFGTGPKYFDRWVGRPIVSSWRDHQKYDELL